MIQKLLFVESVLMTQSNICDRAFLQKFKFFNKDTRKTLSQAQFQNNIFLAFLMAK